MSQKRSQSPLNYGGPIGGTRVTSWMQKRIGGVFENGLAFFGWSKATGSCDVGSYFSRDGPCFLSLINIGHHAARIYEESIAAEWILEETSQALRWGFEVNRCALCMSRWGSRWMPCFRSILMDHYTAQSVKKIFIIHVPLFEDEDRLCGKPENKGLYGYGGHKHAVLFILSAYLCD